MIATAETITHTEPYCSRMTISPERASNWLEHANTNNRKLRDSYVKQLAKDMLQGRWRLTHEAIAFDPHGVLMDGQHRLSAIIKAGIPIEMHVWFDITPDALEVINGGQTRSLADRLRLGRQHGQVTSNHTSTLRAMIGSMAGPATMTSSEASEWMTQHGEAVRFAIHAIPRGRYIANGTTRGVIARAFYSADPKQLKDFGDMLCTGVVPDSNATSVILLRQYLYNNRGGAKSLLRERYAKIERALMAFLQNEPITRLMPTKQELFPLPEEAKA